MAKKRKKHKKSKHDRKAQVEHSQSAVVAKTTSNVTADVSSFEKKSPTDSKAAASKTSAEKAEVDYVKYDSLRSLKIIGVILIVFVALYFVLEKTSFGAQIYTIISL